MLQTVMIKVTQPSSAGDLVELGRVVADVFYIWLMYFIKRFPGIEKAFVKCHYKEGSVRRSNILGVFINFTFISCIS